jgi:hypothetical protein
MTKEQLDQLWNASEPLNSEEIKQLSYGELK